MLAHSRPRPARKPAPNRKSEKPPKGGRLKKFDPTGTRGLAFRVYCGLYGLPADPWFRAAFPHHRLPAEVPAFWEDLIFGVGGSVDAVMIADDPAFAAAFADAVVG